MKNTIAIYTKNGTQYSHTFQGRKTRAQVEQYLILEKKVGRSQIGAISYR